MDMLKYLNKKAVELPMSTLVIMVLVIIVLVAVGILFFQNFISGSSGISAGTDKASQGISVFNNTPPP